jgi:hypothetical protein
VIKLVKVVVPVPSVVLLSEMVGFGEVPQQIPLAVILLPPSFVMLPPPVAVALVIFNSSRVVREGTEGTVVWKVMLLP